MSIAKIKHTLQHHRIAVITGAVIFAVLLSTIFTTFALTTIPEGTITYGVSVSGIPIGGLDSKSATEKINLHLNQFTVPIKNKNHTEQLTPFTSNNIIHTPLAHLSTEAVVAQAQTIGREGNFLQQTFTKMHAKFFGYRINNQPQLNEDLAAQWMSIAFDLGPSAATNAHFILENNIVSIQPEKYGETLLIDNAIRKLKNRVQDLEPQVMTIGVATDNPPVTEASLQPFLEATQAIAKKPSLQLTLKDEQTTLTAEKFIPLLTVNPNSDGLSINGHAAAVTINPWAQPFLNKPENAIFEEKDGRVINFAPHKDGEIIDEESLSTALTAVLFTEGAMKPVEVPLKIIQPSITTELANSYGIKEIIGSGASNFRGSPANRRNNIKVGAASLNGIIIQPNETLSLIKTLGAIDASSGYLPELVIKENKTTPEYGGGLCQIGTTLFRASLDSGLQIPERRNHSYRVPYYERDGNGNYIGPGTDATIYDPSPDLKILNDTATAIMIMTEIKGDKLTFTMWGTKDGRIAERTETKVYNITPPPEPIITETTELPPGQKKCTESAHPGADASFAYKVTHTGGTIYEKTFTSHYKPWGEVCLVGIDPNAPPPVPPPTEPTPTSTADTAGVSGN